jgi:hypothetical protein
MATVKLFVDDFNKGNISGALALCAAPGGIIDEFPPHQWSSCSSWATAYDAYNKKVGVTDGSVTIGTPSHVDVTGSVAYVVVPATYTYKQHGKTVTESGATLTIVLSKMAAGWRVTSWAWAAGKSS